LRLFTTPISRRLLLKGAGVSMALPLLDAMSPLRALAGKSNKGTKPA
jgi:hypothetical protein